MRRQQIDSTPLQAHIPWMQSIAVVCSSKQHPVFAVLATWCSQRGALLTERASDLGSGDFLFLVSCGEMIGPDVRSRFRHTLVLHASDLPRGRGWSPHVWDVLQGANELTLSLLAADDPVDSGDIWHQVKIPVDGTEVCEELNTRLFAAELELMDWAIENCERTVPRKQIGSPTSWPRRTTLNSLVHPEQSLAEIFDLLRVSDPTRFPVRFEHRGAKYELELRRVDPRES